VDGVDTVRVDRYARRQRQRCALEVGAGGAAAAAAGVFVLRGLRVRGDEVAEVVDEREGPGVFGRDLVLRGELEAVLVEGRDGGRAQGRGCVCACVVVESRERKREKKKRGNESVKISRDTES
jgi:hypothetical protein